MCAGSWRACRTRGERREHLQARFVALRQGLERRGWAEGRNIQIDYRYATGRRTNAHERAKELLSLQPDVVIAHTINVALALQRETRTVPIVFVSVGDTIGRRPDRQHWPGREAT